MLQPLPVDPLIINPASYDKLKAIQAAVTYVEGFLDHNGVKHPREYLFRPDDSKKPPGKNGWHDNGWWWNDVVFVNVKRSKPPVKNPGFSWSFTGFKADLTAPGILAHEIGHHVHFTFNAKNKEKKDKLLAQAREAAKQEAPVSSYEPNLYELIAEASRLFILNPVLLADGRPMRYELVTSMGLKPVHETPWRDVLCHAHPRIIKAAESWVKR